MAKNNACVERIKSMRCWKQYTFEANQLKLPASTRIEIMGQKSKKNIFILAIFSTNEDARTIEHQAAIERKKGVS